MKTWTKVAAVAGAMVLGTTAWAEEAATPAGSEPAPCCPVPEEPAPAAAATTAATAETAPPPAADTPPQPDADKDKPQEATGSRASDWTEPADRVAFDLSFKFTNQDGKEVVLADRVGRPMAVTFFYTRCPRPKQGALFVATAAMLQDALQEAGLADKTQLVLISYDPVFDTPERMKKYGEDRGLSWDHAVMLRPDGDQFRAMLGEFQVGVGFDASGNIGHYIELILVDGQGRYVRDYTGTVWENEKVAADLRRLVEEAEAAPSPAATEEAPAAAATPAPDPPPAPVSSTEAIQPEQPAPQEPAPVEVATP